MAAQNDCILADWNGAYVYVMQISIGKNEEPESVSIFAAVQCFGYCLQSGTSNRRTHAWYNEAVLL